MAGAGPGQTGLPRPAINRKWFGDGTQIPTEEGKLHLVSVMDVASRRVLGFTLGEHHDAQLAYGALTMALAVRGGQAPGVIFHTDQGSEYTARSLPPRPASGWSICQSMGRPGSALDNAVIESWHSTLEFELRRAAALHHQGAGAGPGQLPGSRITTPPAGIRRCHMMSPVNYEKALAAGKAA